MLNETEHLLVCLNEECAEVGQEVDKALRFGLDNIYPDVPGELTVRAKIAAEAHQLIAVYEMLVERGILAPLFDNDAVEAKRQKVLKYMDYARDRARLDHNVMAIPEPVLET